MHYKFDKSEKDIDILGQQNKISFTKNEGTKLKTFKLKFLLFRIPCRLSPLFSHVYCKLDLD